MDALLPPFAEPIAQPHIAFQGIEGSFSDGFVGDVDGTAVHIEHQMQVVKNKSVNA